MHPKAETTASFARPTETFASKQSRRIVMELHGEMLKGQYSRGVVSNRPAGALHCTHE